MPARVLLLALVLLTLLTACVSPSAPGRAQPQTASADLTGIKTYLLAKAGELNASAADLQNASGRYFDLAQAANFDYAALWAEDSAEVAQAIADSKSAWMSASPLYEQMEGIVAGVPSLSEYDVILDAGGSGAEDPDNAAPYDLTLSDGRVLERPGNLFGVLESALWGTDPTFAALDADLNGNNVLEFGDSLPDAYVLKAAADSLVAYASELEAASQAWEPSTSDAFTALVVMIPTMNEYFNSWKSSRFVSGAASTQRDFVAISRLADIQDILSSLQVVFQGIEPLASSIDSTQTSHIEQSLADLKAFVADVHAQETAGKQFSAEEADMLGAEAQNRATGLAGQISQIAAQLNIEIEN